MCDAWLYWGIIVTHHSDDHLDNDDDCVNDDDDYDHDNDDDF